MKTTNNVRSVAIAAAVLVSMNAFASDKYQSSYTPVDSSTGKPAVSRRDASPERAERGYSEGDRKRGCDLSENNCPGVNALIPVLVAAEAAYIGEYAFGQLVRRAYTSKASAAKYAPVALGLFGATYAGATLALGGRVQGLNCPKLGLMVLTALAVGVKQWKHEPDFVKAELDELETDAVTALVAQPATTGSSSTAAASTDASKAAKN